MKTRIGVVAAAIALQIEVSAAFQVVERLVPSSGKSKNVDMLAVRSRDSVGPDRGNDDSDSTVITCWNPKLRRAMGAIAGIGVIETGYLTWNKLFSGGTPVLCGTAQGGGCSNVLEGPYSMIPGTDVPLSLLGFFAYACVGFLAIVPTMNSGNNMSQEEESDNRVLLTVLSTAMGVFSVFLMTLLFGVLKESCAFCIASAFFSISLAKLAWLGGFVPSERMKQVITLSTGTGVVAFFSAVLLFTGAPEMSMAGSNSLVFDGSTTQVLAATTSTSESTAAKKSPPPILTSSSPRALEISRDLRSLNTRFFGAYWCSHCYDQKEQLGKEAMLNIPYVECSKDGLNSQTLLCKERDVPGYPTWEINGKLYPGERDLEELEDIIKSARQ